MGLGLLPRQTPNTHQPGKTWDSHGAGQPRLVTFGDLPRSDARARPLALPILGRVEGAGAGESGAGWRSFLAAGGPFLALGRPEAARTTCPDAGGRSGASWAAWRGRASTARAGASENMEGSTRALDPPRRRPRVHPGASPARHHRISTHPAPSCRIQTTGSPSRNHNAHPSPASTACIMAGLSARGRPGCVGATGLPALGALGGRSARRAAAGARACWRPRGCRPLR